MTLATTAGAAARATAADQRGGAFGLWPNRASFFIAHPPRTMGNKIRTEADRLATPRAPAPAGVALTVGRGQKISKERGSHTRSKKNPGKRAHKGG